MTTFSRTLLVLLGCALSGCGSMVRFADRRPLWRDPDEAAIPLSGKRELADNWVRARAGLFSPLDDALALKVNPEAKNVNSLDEVPDSSWFTDRRRAAEVAGTPYGPKEIGADPDDAPDADGPITIVEGKFTGGSRGFVVTDSSKRRFLFKLDSPGFFSLATSTEVVAARLAAAAGRRVPDLTIVDVTPEQLRISKEAKIKDASGNKRPFTAKDLEHFLDGVPRTPEGRLRFSASAWIKGKIVGPYSYVGRRADDPNDRVPHEDRRDLRGYRVFSAWINNVDTIEANTLDTYEGEPGKGHVVHYQQDVGGSFGNYAVGALASWMGYESYFDGPRILASMLAFGAYKRPWARTGIEDERAAALREWPEVGWFEAEHFDPDAWAPLWFNAAFYRATTRDLYWGAKRVLSFSADEIRAAIAAGHYRPEAAARLFDVLWERRERIGRTYLARVAPFERFRFVEGQLCFDDLVVVHGFDRRPAEYAAQGAGAVLSGVDGKRCASLPQGDGYHIVTLRVRRSGERRLGRPVRVHYVEEQHARHVVGLER